MPIKLRAGAIGPALALALALALSLTLGSLPGAHADPASKPDAGGAGDTTEQSSGSAEGSAGKASAEGDGESSGPEPFIPSEKISADSAVSFPVDI